MPKAALILSIVLVTLVAACVQLPWNTSSVTSATGETAMENPDLSINVSAFPTEVKGGRNISVTWNIQNNQLIGLKDVNVEVYDQCLFSGESKKHFDELRPNGMQIWMWSWSSQTTQFERDCEVKFKVTWNSTAFVTQDINVLSETEFYTREQAGTLSDLAGSMTSTTNPITISLDFSEQPPWLNGSTVYMNMGIADTGGGFISKLPNNSINITVPNDTGTVVCDEYRTVVPNLLVLNRDINFANKEATPLSCTLEIFTNNILSTGTLGVTTNYKYELDDSFTVKIKVK